MCSFAEWVYLYMASTCWTVSQLYGLLELQKSHDGGVTAGTGFSVSVELTVHFFFFPLQRIRNLLKLVSLNFQHIYSNFH